MNPQIHPRDDEGPDTVWPPPPTAPPPSPVHFVSAQRFTAGGPASDFREGTLRLDDGGVHLDGRAAVRAEIAFALCLVGALCIFVVGALLVALILEVVGRPAHRHVPWDRVRRVVLAPGQERVCLVFEAPNDRGMPRLWSLTFLFTPASYAPFVAEVERYAPGRAAEGRLHRWLPLHFWVFLAPLLALAIIQVGLVVLSYLHAGP